jgi:hypothetical protein
MNVNELNSVFTDESSKQIEFDKLSNSQSFLLSGGNGLKVGDIVTIPPQPIRMDVFDLGKGQKSNATLCVAGFVLSKSGKEHANKFSLAQLRRRTYGKNLIVVKEGTFPSIETSDIEIVTKIDKEAETAELINEIKFKVAKIETHYVSIFENGKSKIDTDGNLILAAKQQPIFQVIK